ncbi:MAG: DNA adenine methylase [Desulfobacterales bacterium]|nr:DNA adenine methylase [Desulfobacterales bacterium]
MRIEDINEKSLKTVSEKELYSLRGRFIDIYDRYFHGSSLQKAMGLDRNDILNSYLALKLEMRSRGLKFSRETNIDREIFDRIFKSSMWGIDVPSLGDIVVVPDYLSIGGGYVVSPKDAEDVDVIVRESEDHRDESLELKIGRLLKNQTKKDTHFVYAPQGPHSDYLPLFDLVLRAKEGTKRVEVKEDIEKIDFEETEKGIRPAFGSPGGKKYLAHTIVSFILEHKTYVEPFVGGGAVLFAKEPSEEEVINDLDSEIAFAYRFMKRVTDEQIKNLKKHNWEINEETFKRLKGSTPKSDLDRFYKGIYLKKFSYLRIGSYGQGSVSVNRGSMGRKIFLIDRLHILRDRLKEVKVLNRDYKELKKFDGHDSFFYLDPPYPGTGTSRLGGEINMIELHKFCRELKGKFILSLNDDPKNKNLFKDFEIKKVKTVEQIAEGAHSGIRTELLISNFLLKKTNIYLAKGEKEYFEGLDQWDKALKKDNAEVIKNLADGSVLDLGCGTCKLLKLLDNMGYEVKGVDRSDIALEHCKRRNIPAEKADLESKELDVPDNSFDNVVCVHTLEHLRNPKGLIDEAQRIASKRVIILSPLGERFDPTHKQTFEMLEDFKKLFNSSWQVRKIGENNTAIAILDMAELEKKALAPLGDFDPPKPTMSGLTEAFEVEEIWNWAKGRSLVAEPKLNGFRVIICKGGDTVRILTEAKENRADNWPSITDEIRKIPGDFMLDCSMGIERKGIPLPRIKLMTLMAKKPELEEGDIIVCTVFDLPYWKEDLHEKPFKERRKLLEEFYSKHLKASPHFDISKSVSVKDKDDLRSKFKQFAKLPQSEGVVVKDIESTWPTTGRADGWAKLKVEAEIKVMVIERHSVKGGKFNYTCGVLKGDSEFTNIIRVGDMELVNLGKSYNTELRANPGNILTIGVEEIIPRDTVLDWLGPRVIDIDKDRKEPYFANQVVDMARRANILQKAERQEEGAAGEFGNIDFEVGDKGTAVVQLHIMGIEEDEVEKLKQGQSRVLIARSDLKKFEQVLKSLIGEQGAHFDIRFQRKGDKYWEGGEIMLGNLSGLSKIYRYKRGQSLRFAWKQSRVAEAKIEVIRGPLGWMEVGAKKIDIFEPGEVGATAHKYAVMIRVDKLDWEMYLADEHAKKFHITNSRFFDGNWLMGFVPVTEAGKKGKRVWMMRQLAPDDHEKVEKLSLDQEKEYQKETEQIRENRKKAKYPHKFKAAKYTWPNGHPRCIVCGQEEMVDGECEKPLEKLDFELKKEPVFKIFKIDKKKQIVGGVVYEADVEDSQGDIASAEEIQKAMYKFMERYATNTNRIKILHKGKKYFFPILECFQPEQDMKKGKGMVKAGSWWLMIKITSMDIWKQVEEGKLASFSMGGRAAKA